MYKEWKNRLPRISLCFGFLLLSGCYWSFSRPGAQESVTKFVVEGSDFEVMGRVFDEGKINGVLTLFIWNEKDFGYNRLIEKARREYGADSVIDISVDRNFNSLLNIVWSTEWRASGVAIRYKTRATNSVSTESSSLPAPVQDYKPKKGDGIDLLTASWGMPDRVVNLGSGAELYYYERGGTTTRLHVVNDLIANVATVE